MRFVIVERKLNEAAAGDGSFESLNCPKDRYTYCYASYEAGQAELYFPN